jgi:hypothetical protein
MLNGLAPILIFYFPFKLKLPTDNALEGLPLKEPTEEPGLLAQLSAAATAGIPIPLYLDEKLTGIYIDSESKSMDVETTVQVREDTKKAIVDQRGINSLVTLHMIARKDSILLSVFLALNDLIFSKIVAQEYSITYMNGSTVVFGGLLHGFSSEPEAGTDLVRMTLQISKASQPPTTQTQVTYLFPRITGALPVAVGG